MKSRSRTFLRATATAFTVLASAASLHAVTIDFGDGAPGAPAGLQATGASLLFSGGGVNVTATAWRNTSSSGGTFTAARLGQYSSGLGVSGTGGSDSDSDHEVDNIGTFDFVRLSFSQIVDVQSIRLEFVGSDSDLEVWFGNSGTLSTLYASASAVSLAGNGDDRTAFLDSANIIGQHMLIGAFTGGSNDSFKIRNITFNTTTNTVPDGGSTMLLLGVSLVGLGFAARRKKSV